MKFINLVRHLFNGDRLTQTREPASPTVVGKRSKWRELVQIEHELNLDLMAEADRAASQRQVGRAKVDHMAQHELEEAPGPSTCNLCSACDQELVKVPCFFDANARRSFCQRAARELAPDRTGTRRRMEDFLDLNDFDEHDPISSQHSFRVCQQCLWELCRIEAVRVDFFTVMKQSVSLLSEESLDSLEQAASVSDNNSMVSSGSKNLNASGNASCCSEASYVMVDTVTSLSLREIQREIGPVDTHRRLAVRQ